MRKCVPISIWKKIYSKEVWTHPLNLISFLSFLRRLKLSTEGIKSTCQHMWDHVGSNKSVKSLKHVWHLSKQPRFLRSIFSYFWNTECLKVRGGDSPVGVDSTFFWLDLKAFCVLCQRLRVLTPLDKVVTLLLQTAETHLGSPFWREDGAEALVECQTVRPRWQMRETLTPPTPCIALWRARARLLHLMCALQQWNDRLNHLHFINMHLFIYNFQRI